MEPKNTQEFIKISSSVRGADDPIESARPKDQQDAAERAKRLLGFIDTVDEIRSSDQDINNPNYGNSLPEKSSLNLLKLELELDYIYSKNDAGDIDLSDFNANAKELFNFIDTALSEMDPGDKINEWRIRTKQLDLLAFSVYRNAKESRTTLKDTPFAKMVYDLSTEDMKALVGYKTVALLNEMRYHTAHNLPEAQKTRGMIFETLVIGYARLQTLLDGTFDSIFIRSALDREDNYKYPDGLWPSDGQPRRTFDLLVHNDDENTNKLYQLKNNEYDGKTYIEPIVLIKGHNFGDIIKDLPLIIVAFHDIVKNLGNDSGQTQINVDKEDLDSIFRPLIDVSKNK